MLYNIRNRFKSRDFKNNLMTIDFDKMFYTYTWNTLRFETLDELLFKSSYMYVDVR